MGSGASTITCATVYDDVEFPEHRTLHAIQNHRFVRQYPYTVEMDLLADSK
jgi:hypothetical protein